MSRKRYNLALPEEEFERLQQAADERGITMLEVIRGALKLDRLLHEANTTIYIKRISDPSPKEVVIIS